MKVAIQCDTSPLWRLRYIGNTCGMVSGEI